MYQQQDIKNTLYDGSAIVADGDSAEIDFNVPGGCPDAELVLSISGRATGESVSFLLKSWNGSTYDTLYLRLGSIAANVNEIVIPVNNRVITGSKFKMTHDVTLPTGGGLIIHGHIRPRL